MKKLAAILLLGIFAFNLFGYHLIASILETKENRKMELAFDANNYGDDQQLFTIKQPTNLPYYQNSATFQRINGEVEIAGVFYKYVKCRIYNDSLELLCLPNTGKMNIQAAKIDFSKQAADVQQSINKKNSQSENKSIKNVLAEFENVGSLEFTSQSQMLNKIQFFNKCYFIKNCFLPTDEQPPDHC